MKHLECLTKDILSALKKKNPKQFEPIYYESFKKQRYHCKLVLELHSLLIRKKKVLYLKKLS